MVFIRKDGHVAPLAPLYEGPYKVLSHSLKTFQLQVGKRVEVVSVQRLEPAFTAEDEVQGGAAECYAVDLAHDHHIFVMDLDWIDDPK